jgi:hypothetical protein
MVMVFSPTTYFPMRKSLKITRNDLYSCKSVSLISRKNETQAVLGEFGDDAGEDDEDGEEDAEEIEDVAADDAEVEGEDDSGAHDALMSEAIRTDCINMGRCC